MSDVETEPVETEPEPETEPDEETDETLAPEGRCEAETTVGGNTYRCSLEVGHDDDHAFAVVDADDTDEPDETAVSEAAMLDANKKVARAAQTYWNKVREQYGQDLGGFHECPLCVGYPPGLYWPAELPPEKGAALRTILGMPSLDNYKRDNKFLTCATCDGLGTVLTGSRVPGKATHACVDCKGFGYISHEPSLQPPDRAPILDSPANGGEVIDGDPPAFDPWGRPYGDPDYYRMPIAGVTT